MRLFELNIKKLALLLTPEMLRNVFFGGFVLSFVGQLGYIQTELIKFRKEKNIRLKHNGQVCYLQAILNDLYDPDLLPEKRRRIKIFDAVEQPDCTVYKRYSRAENISFRLTQIPIRESSLALSVPQRNTSRGALGFQVQVPSEIYKDKLKQIYSTINEYRLTSVSYSVSIK